MLALSRSKQTLVRIFRVPSLGRRHFYAPLLSIPNDCFLPLDTRSALCRTYLN